jgi:hypothetical protein
MAEAVAVRERRSASRSCRHHWIIETPHGATSRGLCKRCGAQKRFPNAPEPAVWGPAASMGRWANRRGATKPTDVQRPNQKPSKN